MRADARGGELSEASDGRVERQQNDNVTVFDAEAEVPQPSPETATAAEAAKPPKKVSKVKLKGAVKAAQQQQDEDAPTEKAVAEAAVGSELPAEQLPVQDAQPQIDTTQPPTADQVPTKRKVKRRSLVADEKKEADDVEKTSKEEVDKKAEEELEVKAKEELAVEAGTQPETTAADDQQTDLEVAQPQPPSQPIESKTAKKSKIKRVPSAKDDKAPSPVTTVADVELRAPSEGESELDSARTDVDISQPATEDAAVAAQALPKVAEQVAAQDAQPQQQVDTTQPPTKRKVKRRSSAQAEKSAVDQEAGVEAKADITTELTTEAKPREIAETEHLELREESKPSRTPTSGRRRYKALCSSLHHCCQAFFAVVKG